MNEQLICQDCGAEFAPKLCLLGTRCKPCDQKATEWLHKQLDSKMFDTSPESEPFEDAKDEIERDREDANRSEMRRHGR